MDGVFSDFDMSGSSGTEWFQPPEETDDAVQREQRLLAAASSSMLPDEVLVKIAQDVVGTFAETWDMPSMLFSLEPADDLDQYLDRLPAGNVAAGVLLRPLARSHEHPTGMLSERLAPSGSLGLVLVMECWSHPPDAELTPDSPPPSESPDRVESHDVLLMTADGRIAMAHFVRDVGLVGAEERNQRLTGTLPLALRGAMGLGAEDQDLSIDDVLLSLLWLAPPLALATGDTLADPLFPLVMTVAHMGPVFASMSPDEMRATILSGVLPDTEATREATRTVELLRAAAEHAAHRDGDWFCDPLAMVYVLTPARQLVVPLAMAAGAIPQDRPCLWQPDLVTEALLDTAFSGARPAPPPNLHPDHVARIEEVIARRRAVVARLRRYT